MIADTARQLRAIALAAADLDRVSRWAYQVAGLGGDRLFNFSLRVARRQAWSAAERLAAPSDPVDRERYRAELDGLARVR